MGFLNDLLADPIGVIQGRETVSERQDRQWQHANDSLRAAVAVLAQDDPDHQGAIAAALVGLLSLQLSRT